MDLKEPELPFDGEVGVGRVERDWRLIRVGRELARDSWSRLWVEFESALKKVCAQSRRWSSR